MRGPVLRARGLVKHHGRGQSLVRAVDEVDLEVHAGQTLAVMGPSGCGKSTLLHLLGGLERPTAGEVWVAGRRIDTLSERALARLRRRSVGFVFQAFHLVEELSAAENVELPVLLAGRSPREARRRASLLLDRVGLADRARHLPSRLSGGQRQRVAIARALAPSPDVIVLDEPVSALDTVTQAQILALLRRLQDKHGTAYLLISHDLAVVAAAAGRLAVMRDGRIVESGPTAEVLAAPGAAFTRELLAAIPGGRRAG